MKTRHLVALVDCSAFYCSCERAFRPDLKHKPIVVLSNNDGCVISRDRQAKSLGVPMGAPYFKVRRDLERKGIVVFSSNYALYADLSRRVMATLERFTPDVDIHSIDEAFLTLRASVLEDGQPAPGERERLEADAREIRLEVERAIGIGVRVSIAETRTLAKAASEYARDHGGTVCFWGHPDRDAFLRSMPVGDVWGIGPRWSARLEAENVKTAAAFASLSEERLRPYTVVGTRTAWELRGVPCHTPGAGPTPRRSLVRSRSFGRRTPELGVALEAVANHAARAAEKLRAEGLAAGALQVFVTTGGSRHGDGPHRHGTLMTGFVHPTSSTATIVRTARRLLQSCHRPTNARGVPYRYMKAGVILTELSLQSACQADLFVPKAAEKTELWEALDRINRQFGRHTVALASQGSPSARVEMDAGRGGPAWAMRREMMSPRYTVSWDDLPTAA
ncbi:Y-family DNA polymerase [Rubrivirga sp.]|uniref:Y-family DNA polymerase n=1 Tax=Rubrivirga sp. TaxID=1885344 RepID=UPI003C76094E